MTSKFAFKPQREREVWDACNALYAEGLSAKEITGKAVAERLIDMGFREGNPNYRYKYINTWLQHQGLSKDISLEQPVLSHPTDVISRGAEIFRKSIEETIEQEYAAKFQETERVREEAINRAQQLSIELDKQRSIYQTLSREQDHLKAERKQFVSDMTQLHSDKALLESQLVTLDQSYQLLKTEQNQYYQDYKQRSEQMLARLREELDRANALRHEETKESRDALDKTRNTLLHEVDILKREVHKLKEALYKSELVAKSMQDENKQLITTNKTIDHDLHVLQKERDNLYSKIHKHEKALSASGSQLEEVRQIANDYKKMIHLQQNEIAKSSEQIGYLRGQLKQQEKRPKRIKQLLQEK